MARHKANLPALRYHISGQSVCTIEGRNFYLGPHEHALTVARYACLIQAYQENGHTLPVAFGIDDVRRLADARFSQLFATRQADMPVLVEHVTAAYREEIKQKYPDQPAEQYRYSKVCDVLEEQAGKLLACEYGPIALRQQRQRWVDEGLSRKYCNRLVASVCRIFNFAVSQELIDEGTHRRLLSLEPLRENQTTAHETEPIQPVALEHVRATVKELSPVVRAMIRVQIATGMRPSELCNIRPCDIDRSGPVWMYRPPKHKNKSKGKSRAIPIIDDARDAITDYLNRPATSFCFSPIEADRWFRAKQSSERKGAGSRKQKQAEPKTQPGEQYKVASYRQAVERAAKRAKVPHWHPYQLRHLTLTEVRNALDGESAQALAGHSRMQMTEHYARLNESKAIEAAKAAPKLGKIE